MARYSLSSYEKKIIKMRIKLSLTLKYRCATYNIAQVILQLLIAWLDKNSGNVNVLGVVYHNQAMRCNFISNIHAMKNKYFYFTLLESHKRSRILSFFSTYATLVFTQGKVL